jgi:hypothetical protein
MTMRSLLTLAALLLPACAPLFTPSPVQDTPVLVRSHNAGDVDVYLLCGDHDARWLGRVASRGSEAWAISPPERRCAEGVNFFLVSHHPQRGYWVGPLRPGRGSAVTLVIEKYAGLSTLSLSDPW